MTDRKRMYNGASNAAWGYVLLYFDINLGRVSILPKWAGFLLLLSAADAWKEERRDLALLRPLGLLLVAWNGADWLLSWGGGDLDGRFLLLDLLIGAASLYFHFQLLTDAAALAEKYQPPEGKLDRDLLRWRTVQAVLTTGIAVINPLSPRLGEAGTLLVGVLSMAGAIMGVVLMLQLFALRRLFRENEPSPPAPAGPQPRQ